MYPRFCVTHELVTINLKGFFHFIRRFRKTAKERLLASSFLSVSSSVLMEQLCSHCTDFIKFDIRLLFENLSEKFKLH
jgi:hypothetical protein